MQKLAPRDRRKIDAYIGKMLLQCERGFWDGSFKDDGKSSCGIVIKEVDRQKWVTISKIAVLLKVGAAMAAEVLGVCVLHECPRSDPLQKSECTEHQSTNKPDPSLLTVHAF